MDRGIPDVLKGFQGVFPVRSTQWLLASRGGPSGSGEDWLHHTIQPLQVCMDEIQTLQCTP